MKITVTTLLHKRPSDRTVTAYADEDAARDALHAWIAPRWNDIRCQDRDHCVLDWCTGTRRSLSSLTRDQVIDDYRHHLRHTDAIAFDTHEVNVDVDTVGLLAVFGTDRAAVDALARLDDLTRDRIAIALTTVADDNSRALVLTTVRHEIDADYAMHPHLNEDDHTPIGVLFSTYKPDDEGHRVHREADVLFDNGVIVRADFGDEVADALHALYGFQSKHFTVALDLRTNTFDGDDTPGQTIYDRFNTPDLTLTPDDALRELRDVADAATSDAEDPATLVRKFEQAWRALDTSMSAGASAPERWANN